VHLDLAAVPAGDGPDRRWLASSRAFSSLILARSALADRLRGACHIITPNIARVQPALAGFRAGGDRPRTQAGIRHHAPS
jgi:hypothetical protein